MDVVVPGNSGSVLQTRLWCNGGRRCSGDG